VKRARQFIVDGAVWCVDLRNVMLDDLDWELDRRGHRFVRYVDDGRIYVANERAGQRGMESITHYVKQRLKLNVSREKSVVDRAVKRPLLGFGFMWRRGEVIVRIDPKARSRATDRVRQFTSRRWGVLMERRIDESNRFTVGWTVSFSLATRPRRLRNSTIGSEGGLRRAWYPDNQASMGLLSQGVLAHRRLCTQLQRALPNVY
jgi:hypothetical protein